MTMSGLAQQVALSSGGITRLLDRIIAAGLVERVPCPTDRRVQYAALTDTGRARLEQAAAVQVRQLRRTFEHFSADDVRTLDELLDRLRVARIS